MTVTTKENEDTGVKGDLFYDGDCVLCCRWKARFEKPLNKLGYRLIPLQDAIATGNHPIPPEAFMREIQLRKADGQWLGGVDALLDIGDKHPWLRPLAALCCLPGIHNLCLLLYRLIANNRHCANGICQMKNQRNRTTPWLPLILLLGLSLMLRPSLEPWIGMWAIALAIYAGCKWLTLQDAMPQSKKPPFNRVLAYLLMWPGMDATRFLNDTPTTNPGRQEWLFAAAKTALGVGLWLCAGKLMHWGYPLVAAWFGMVGIVMMFHFGTFHLLALLWRRTGYDAQPTMNWPIMARTLAEFWGKRWNLAFNHLATVYCFRPLTRRLDPKTALILTFLLSGLVHELVITLPARGGYGLPTLYFIIQGIGIALQRTPYLRLHPRLNYALTAFALVAPLPLLFPPAFIEQVVIPMIKHLTL